MQATKQIFVGKRGGDSLMAASGSVSSSRRLFVTYPALKATFLIDTGADLCVYPRHMVPQKLEKADYQLTAANNGTIDTYGTTTLELSLGLRRSFLWRFVIGDISKPIVGADFLAHYGLLVDLQDAQLIDKSTNLTSKGHVQHTPIHSVKVITGDS